MKQVNHDQDHNTTYQVREFARLAGVTVRTLHYYDEAGLLKPARVAQNGFRYYYSTDLLRLQQILTLKYMGFSLTEIRSLLKSPGYDIFKSLTIQKQAIDRQISQLQQVSAAMEKIISTKPPAELDWQGLHQIIQGLKSTEKDKADWINQYYNPEQLAWLKERSQRVSPEQIQLWTQQWTNLAADLRANSHLPPESPSVQELMGKMAELVAGFTAGRTDLVESLTRMYNNFEQIPVEYRLYDKDLQEFINRAQIVYQKNLADSSKNEIN